MTSAKATSTPPFTGDCLFPGGVGKTWEPGGFEQLLGDVTNRVFDVCDDATVVYPGHGDDTTLGAERPHLAEWGRAGLVTALNSVGRADSMPRIRA